MRTCNKIDCNNKHKNIKYDLCNSCLGRTECREKDCKKFVDVPYQWCFHHKKKFTNYLEKGYAFIDDESENIINSIIAINIKIDFKSDKCQPNYYKNTNIEELKYILKQLQIYEFENLLSNN